MSRFWSKVVHGLTPYVPGEQPRIDGLIKLNTNECPYPPSDKVLQAIAAQTTGDLRLYPDPQAAGLKAAIAHHHGLKAEQVFVGNGSDEVLAHAFMALLRHPAPLLHPDISYSFYPVYARLYGIETREIALRADFSIAVDDYLQAGPNGGIIFPNPNAPTGMALPLAEVERLLAGNPDSVVVVDEAYVDFGAQTAAPLIDRYPQLLVIRTLSKAWALAGLRVGYALGHPDLIEALSRVKDSFNSYPLDRLALAGATAALSDAAWLAQTSARIQASREALSEGLRARGFEVLPSQANFVFARHPAHEGASLAAQLRKQRILVRQFARPQRIADFLRITIGTPQQCEALLNAYDAVAQQAAASR
ncbi:Histidinol-phosphate aminotransferase 2 [Thiomonas arsenitoxydans]|uniref:Histidinol-phosphate aminotransferase n=1 Tax=Thiomonas arsenitoxydans (strain DSM 22701 / CIP 110005 / 3As) TaxID=426114 RepID=D6CL56_THIA3|nr:histidinol-phosphate transaminase [Thiomonas arsenitoxydans]CAZ87809.1 putative Histidinol-phosphate aminotransferase (Imidazole acetol-phosphate transaminase) hisC [Thiomonas arsenitoxydans]CQR26662.1 Histidinol-phosphate aminotransferase 2 [Thiomonas arsenitoxydans]CQR27424.1 Histidinol-phosphate aminotransferase 2 [Thiomonas arsenitoxydans]CQR30980.1 Histidinol-phosphate aminotransferase 2 [Thiomonas arsenitoxydans]CQR30983.1 Histidinol-phosphate aminotransferase 2 [Thiomonas arsenitoxyd